MRVCVHMCVTRCLASCRSCQTLQFTARQGRCVPIVWSCTKLRHADCEPSLPTFSHELCPCGRALHVEIWVSHEGGGSSSSTLFFSFFFFPPSSFSLLPTICGDSMDEQLPLGQWILLKDFLFFVRQLCHFLKARSFVKAKPVLS